MKSIIKFLLFFLAIVLVITWLVTIYKAGNNEMEPTDSQAENTELSDEIENSDEEILEEMNDEQLDEEYNNILEDSDDGEEYEDDYEEEDIQEEAVEVSEETPLEEEENEVELSTESNNSTSYSNESLPYMVIVGSFLVPGNAEAKKNKISKLGFDGEVVNFDLSQYHTVLAGRYNTFSEAQSTVNNLKAKGVDAYAKKREK